MILLSFSSLFSNADLLNPSTAALNLLSGVAILSSVAVPLYLSVKVRNSIRKLTLLLSAFVLIHAAYHLAIILGLGFLGSGVFDPLSVGVLIIFGLYYLILNSRRTGRNPNVTPVVPFNSKGTTSES